MNHIIWYIVYIMYEHEFDVQANNFLKVVVRPRPQIVGPVVCPWSRCDTGYHWTLIFKIIIKRDSSIVNRPKIIYSPALKMKIKILRLFSTDMICSMWGPSLKQFVLIISYWLFRTPFCYPTFIKNIINTTFE